MNEVTPMIEIKTMDEFLELPADTQQAMYSHIVNLVLYAGAAAVAEVDVRKMMRQPNLQLLEQYDVFEDVIRELVISFVKATTGK